MKITKQRLKEMIKEELTNLNERSSERDIQASFAAAMPGRNLRPWTGLIKDLAAAGKNANEVHATLRTHFNRGLDYPQPTWFGLRGR